ncbi:MAG TPA: hypothetical protein VGM98_02975, partial [Schlesneria sp.]
MPRSAEGFQPLDRHQNTVIRRWLWGIVALVVVFGSTTVSQAASSDADIIARINEFLRQYWKDNDVTPSERADDGEF